MMGYRGGKEGEGGEEEEIQSNWNRMMHTHSVKHNTSHINPHGTHHCNTHWDTSEVVYW